MSVKFVGLHGPVRDPVVVPSGLLLATLIAVSATALPSSALGAKVAPSHDDITHHDWTTAITLSSTAAARRGAARPRRR